MKETYLTSEGLHDLQDKLHELKTVRRREIADAIHSAKEQGDLSENAEYVNAKEEQSRTEQQIAELEATLKHAQIITKLSTASVEVGNGVTVRCDGTDYNYKIVGSNEADPLKGKISNESPVGQALLHRKKGDTVSIPAPAGARACEIINIT